MALLDAGDIAVSTCPRHSRVKLTGELDATLTQKETDDCSCGDEVGFVDVVLEGESRLWRGRVCYWLAGEKKAIPLIPAIIGFLRCPEYFLLDAWLLRFFPVLTPGLQEYLDETRLRGNITRWCCTRASSGWKEEECSCARLADTQRVKFKRAHGQGEISGRRIARQLQSQKQVVRTSHFTIRLEIALLQQPVVGVKAFVELSMKHPDGNCDRGTRFVLCIVKLRIRDRTEAPLDYSPGIPVPHQLALNDIIILEETCRNEPWKHVSHSLASSSSMQQHNGPVHIGTFNTAFNTLINKILQKKIDGVKGLHVNRANVVFFGSSQPRLALLRPCTLVFCCNFIIRVRTSATVLRLPRVLISPHVIAPGPPALRIISDALRAFPPPCDPNQTQCELTKCHRSHPIPFSKCNHLLLEVWFQLLPPPGSLKRYSLKSGTSLDWDSKQSEVMYQLFFFS
ncbi:hypothetical protein VP01_136g6 [Puccinia sorghi]|uniref:Uncharacterized protein n=1 Tax=Puccinia sorghi TaxID=27349 RepID=A0A0L6VNJ7_9BASI|nr:hypothetical protein VP01_136g6 [Puccinia sorghi]